MCVWTLITHHAASVRLAHGAGVTEGEASVGGGGGLAEGLEQAGSLLRLLLGLLRLAKQTGGCKPSRT